MALPPPLNDVWPIVANLDWKDPAFDRRKAYVCAIMSNLAYGYLQEYETAKDSRFNVVPSELHRAMIRGEITLEQLQQLVRNADLPAPTVVAGRYTVTIIVNVRQVVFVAIRGTHVMHDWFVNLRCWRRTHGKLRSAKFHKGFFRALYSTADELVKALGPHAEARTPIYVTGHSLGGAVAAVMHATFELSRARTVDNVIEEEHHRSVAAYTFGMPRYANRAGMDQFRTPHHIYNERDVVPCVPPKWLGYGDCPSEYLADGKRLGRRGRAGTLAHFAWLWRLAKGVGVAAHDIEGYRESLADVAKARIR